jgi:DNA-binding response OmpR family regulator
MTRLREKLETDPAAPPLFLTEPAVGYRLVEQQT